MSNMFLNCHVSWISGNHIVQDNKKVEKKPAHALLLLDFNWSIESKGLSSFKLLQITEPEKMKKHFRIWFGLQRFLCFKNSFIWDFKKKIMGHSNVDICFQEELVWLVIRTCKLGQFGVHCVIVKKSAEFFQFLLSICIRY